MPSYEGINIVTRHNKQSVDSNLNSALTSLFEPISISWNVGTFEGNIYKHKNVVRFEGMLTITSAVTGYNTVLFSLYGKGITLSTFSLAGYVNGSFIELYASGYNVLARSGLSVGTKIYFDCSVPI